MSDALLLGIDLGAGSLKSTVITARGEVVANASAPVETLTPRPGHSEQDPAGWWAALVTTLAALWAEGVDPDRVVALSLTAGAHTSVLEDASGAVLRPAIMWNDARSGAQVTRGREAAGAEILALSGNRISATWTLPQLMWLADEEPRVHERIARLLPAKDWLRRKLDGSTATDITDAWGIMLADATSGGWSPRLCALAGIDPAVLPAIVGSTDVTGTVTAAAAAQTGLRAGTTVICGTSDTNAETYSAGMTRPGIGALKLATAATVSTLTTTPAFSDDVIHYPHLVPGHAYAITATNSCASAHRWLRDALFEDIGFDGMDRKAQAAPAGSDGLLFHPYLSGERSPYWDPDLRASFVGLGFAHKASHICRALYEGVAYSLRDCLEVLRGRGIGFTTARLVGGGTRSALWRQIIADVTGLTIEVPAEGDASFGAALIAGIGAGVFADTDDAAKAIRVDETLQPNAADAAVYDAGFALFREAAQALTPVNHGLVAAARGAR
ncbi:xylulokinase [Acuticoccus sp. I52.16.1]|uniref:xylulokinase n=1 Tax=Acuticoccus sp. I52.16.1 TaxID=2928472 RepID=UPI001FD430AE|nr:xylulokinase [Acuticoccus sp. I52.16.1]UOM35414.1 FGGY family carbohydrate kinase [Acuticoccus sp. I52.16.1]